MDDSSQEERDRKLQDGCVNAAQENEATAQPAQEDQPGPELDFVTHPSYSDHIDENEHSPEADSSVLENIALIPQLSHLNISEEMEDRDPLPEEGEEEEEDEEEEEEGEYIVLDPEQQTALSIQLQKRLERINLAIEQVEEHQVPDISDELSGVQQQLARLQTKLEDIHQAKEEAEAKHQQRLEQLEVKRSQYARITDENRKAKSSASQLQAELDNLMLHLDFTQGVSENLRSHVKTLKNARNKSGAEKNQAEEQKLKQDLYVERLTKNVKGLEQQIAMYEAQAKAQSEKTQAAKEALSEAKMEMESLAMARKQLLQQWSCSLVGMGQQDEAFSAMQEAIRDIKHQGILLDREIEGYKKSVTEEQEYNETLTMQLNWSQMDCDTSKEQISQKQSQQEALHAQYSTCLRTLKETEGTLARLSKEQSIIQVEVDDQRKQFEKESAARLELEDKIKTNMQQKLTHNKAAKYSQRLTSQKADQKSKKISQLLQLENNVVSLEQESSKVIQHLDNLAVTQEALEEEIAKNNKILTAYQAEVSSLVLLIGQKQALIANCNKKIHQIAAKTGRDDLSPMQIKIHALMAQTDELAANIVSVKRLLMKRQGILSRLTQDKEANSKEMLKLQTGYTGFQQKKVCLESQVEAELRDEMELENNAERLRGDLLKLNTLLSKKGQLSVALKKENLLMETDFLQRRKEAEREFIEMQIKLEKTEEEKERLHNSLLEAQCHIMLWEKKIQLVKEARSVLEKETGEIEMIKKEIHRMEVRLTRLRKRQKQLIRDSVASIARREPLLLRREAMLKRSTRTMNKGELNRVIQALQRKIKDAHKHVVECEQVIRQLQESKVTLSDRLTQQKRKLVDLCSASYALDADIVNHRTTKDSNLDRLVALQSRNKKLQGVIEGKYKPLSNSESIGAALQSKMERLHTISTILHRVCQEFPEHQGALHRLLLTLEAGTQALEQGMF